jgi:hypothetical protein
MFKIKEIAKTANEAIVEILKDKDWKLTDKSPYLCSSNGYNRRG